MNFADFFKGVLGGDPIKSISDLIADFKLPPEQKLEFQQAAAALEERREEIEAARDQAIADIQGQNIRAETSSSDTFVRRARPAFLWMMILAMGVDLIIFPLLNLATHRGLVILEIPPAYLELFGTAFLGYVGARTWEKAKGKD